MGLFRRSKRSPPSTDYSLPSNSNNNSNMTVDPKEDVDICITCLTKTAPKLPLREELPSLGVELIYRARGMGAKVSKHQAHQAARDFRYKESFKDLAKCRLFRKSSRRIKSILEERRRRESEIKHISSAVSYESYQNELYGDWVTDTSSSSSQSKSSVSSSSTSSVSEVKTNGNRRMTKSALKRWKLFRKKSQRRREKLNQKKEEKKRKNKKKPNTQVSLGSLIGEDVFADFLAPLPRVDDVDEDQVSRDDSKGSERPSWYAGLPKSVGSETLHASSPNTKRTPGQSVRSGSSGYSGVAGSSQATAGGNDRNKPGRHNIDTLSPASKRSGERPKPSSPNSYPTATSPFSGRFGSTPNSKSPGKGTPETMATSPFGSSQDTVSTGSVRATRRERLHGGGSKKLSRYLSQRKQQHESGQDPSIRESESKESTSDTSLIGLSVAFPKDDIDLDMTNVSPNHSLLTDPQKTYFGKVVDSYVSEDSESKESRDDESAIVDTVPSNVYPEKSFSWKDASVLGAPSDEFHQQPFQKTKKAEGPKSNQQSGVELWAAGQPSPQFFDDIPEDLYQAFGRNESEKNENPKKPKNEPRHGPLFHTTVVVPGQEDMSEIASYHPIVKGVDLQDDTNESDDSEDYFRQSNKQVFSAKSESFEGKQEAQRRNVLAKWWKGEEVHDSDYEEEEIRQTKIGSPEGQQVEQITSVKGPWWSGAMPKIPGFVQKKWADSKGQIDVIEISSSDGSEMPQVLTEYTNQDESPVTGNESGANAIASVEGTPGNEEGVNPKFDTSTAQAFSDIPDEFYGDLPLAKSKQDGVPKQKTEDDEQSFRSVLRGQQYMLSQYDTELSTVKRKIADDPTLVQLKDQDDGQMFLHLYASSPFPPHVDCEDFLDLLLDDIRIFREKLEVIYDAFPAASEVVNSDGDLPVHLLARNLMHWETTWYARVYDQASKESENTVPGGPATAAITTLYHTMSLCVETLLKRVVMDGSLCRERGSMGSLLPLHIATIFTSSVPTLRQALESYPIGAFEAAWIKGFKSFVPDGTLPIEIHDSFCTDFPKWEVEKRGEDETSWSQCRDAGMVSLDDSIRRSDLLFAYNPSIQRFWKDKARICRIECRINFEAKQVALSQRDELTKTSKLLWIWMCTFAEGKSSQAVFSKSVKNIVGDLPMSLVRMLAIIPAQSGEAVVDVAHPDCVTVIRNRLDHLSEETTPIATKSMSSRGTNSKVLQSWEENLSSKMSFAGKVSLGQICRAIFNINEKEIPTSFVILPYKLARNASGTLGMSSAESAKVAVEFADCLLKLTDPRSVLYYLDKKSKSYFGVSMYEGATDADARNKAFSDVVLFEKSLLDLYACRVAYLYLLDEESGVPLVPISDDDVYPMILNEPVSMVRKLLPIMVSGMIQMRGDKAVNVVTTALLDDSITIVPSHYQNAAKKLGIFMHGPSTPRAASIDDSSFIKSELNRFLSSYHLKRHGGEESLTGTTEWNVELSILRMLFEVNDPKSTFSGLKVEDTPDGEIRWVFDENFEVSHLPKQIQAKRNIHLKNGSESSSQDSNDSPDDSYETFGADPLKFHQPPDDATETTYETQATHTLNATNTSESNLGINLTASDDSTESERIHSKNRLFVDTFAARVESPFDLNETSTQDERDDKPDTWSPAQQVEDDTQNRLDASGFFWDEAQVTSLRVGLAQQANRLCTLRKRIMDIKEEESQHALRVHELFCKIMGDNSNVIEVPSPRSLFGARRLLARLNELENRLMENEVDSQHFCMGVAALNEEIFDLVPLLEEEVSSSESDCALGSYLEIQSCISESDAESSDADGSSSKIVSITSSKIVSVTSECDPSIQAVKSFPASRTSSSNHSGAWSASRSIERIRKAFAAARRSDPSFQQPSSRLSVASGSVTTKNDQPDEETYHDYPDTVDDITTDADSEQGFSKTSTITESRSTILRRQAAAARSRASAAAQPPRFPFEIDLPALDHMDKYADEASDSRSQQQQQQQQKQQRDPILEKPTVQRTSSSGSSSSPLDSSIVHYDKATGRIEF
eukprot:scaffold15421_cov168-Amphora_coffeaeformis.AAC.1